MQRGASGSTTGNYNATMYDKTSRMSVRGLQPGLKGQETEDSVLGDLFICLLGQKKMLAVSSDFELIQGYELFSRMLKNDSKLHEAMFGVARINYILGRYETSERLLIKAYETKRDFTYRVWLGYT
jgi:hypothetical protein